MRNWNLSLKGEEAAKDERIKKLQKENEHLEKDKKALREEIKSLKTFDIPQDSSQSQSLKDFKPPKVELEHEWAKALLLLLQQLFGRLDFKGLLKSAKRVDTNCLSQLGPAQRDLIASLAAAMWRCTKKMQRNQHWSGFVTDRQKEAILKECYFALLPHTFPVDSWPNGDPTLSANVFHGQETKFRPALVKPLSGRLARFHWCFTWDGKGPYHLPPEEQANFIELVDADHIDDSMDLADIIVTRGRDQEVRSCVSVVEQEVEWRDLPVKADKGLVEDSSLALLIERGKKRNAKLEEKQIEHLKISDADMRLARKRIKAAEAHSQLTDKSSAATTLKRPGSYEHLENAEHNKKPKVSVNTPSHNKYPSPPSFGANSSFEVPPRPQGPRSHLRGTNNQPAMNWPRPSDSQGHGWRERRPPPGMGTTKYGSSAPTQTDASTAKPSHGRSGR